MVSVFNLPNLHVSDHPNFQIARSCLANLSPEKFWAITAEYPDLVCQLHVQITMIGWLGLNGGIPWLLKQMGHSVLFAKVILKLLITFVFIVLPSARVLRCFGLVGTIKSSIVTL